MSLYVVPENQELLWNVINKNQYIDQYFAQFNPEKKHEWFKTIIHSFYEKYKRQKITVTELNSINKETILHMIESIRDRINTPIPNTTAVSKNEAMPSYQPTSGMSISTPPIVPDTRQDTHVSQFEQRQLEYTAMNKRNEPDQVDFTEKMEDGAISNMDDLIKQQMEQREYDMNNMPAPAPGQLNTVPLVEVTPVAPLDPSSNISISINEEDKPTTDVIVDKKTVTWQDIVDLQICKDDIAKMRDEMELIRQDMRNQSTIIDSLRNDLTKYQGDSVNTETTQVVEDMIQNVETNTN